MTTKKEKIEKISESLYEKLFYGKPVVGGEGLGFHMSKICRMAGAHSKIKCPIFPETKMIILS